MNHGRPDDVCMLFSIFILLVAVLHTWLQLSSRQTNTSPTTISDRTWYRLFIPTKHIVDDNKADFEFDLTNSVIKVPVKMFQKTKTHGCATTLDLVAAESY